VAATARELGFSLLPWQRLVLSTALERSGRRPAYRDCLVSTGRQAGKSVLAVSLIVWWLLAEPDRLVLYSAQSRVSARRRLLHNWWPRIARSPLAPRFRLFRGFGAECLQADNGSRLELVSATESSGHGETSSLIVVDEAWVHQDATLEQATRPTLMTSAGGQFWTLSAAGTPRSTWWWTRLQAGRAAAEMGVDSGLCLLEWGASPDADPTDEQVWWQAMPALGKLVDVETVRADLANMGHREFRRAFLNVWESEAEQGWKVIPKELWEETAL
jgi:phage terminase large subunit-like protein